MTSTDKNVKQRIYEAATALFARKGYAATGMREIAHAAGVNLSRVTYYFSGKLGLLRAVLTDYWERYYQALAPVADLSLTGEERVRRTARNMVGLFREHTELALAAVNSHEVPIPEIHDLRAKIQAAHGDALVEHLRRLGLDIEDHVLRSLLSGLLTTIILQHFRDRFVAKEMLKSPEWRARTNRELPRQPEAEPDDAFYARFAELLADLYLRGIRGLAVRPEVGSEEQTRGQQ
jgi:TetR/AcrR family transcriptional regulator